MKLLADKIVLDQGKSQQAFLEVKQKSIDFEFGHLHIDQQIDLVNRMIEALSCGRSTD